MCKAYQFKLKGEKAAAKKKAEDLGIQNSIGSPYESPLLQVSPPLTLPQPPCAMHKVEADFFKRFETTQLQIYNTWGRRAEWPSRIGALIWPKSMASRASQPGSSRTEGAAHARHIAGSQCSSHCSACYGWWAAFVASRAAHLIVTTPTPTTILILLSGLPIPLSGLPTVERSSYP